MKIIFGLLIPFFGTALGSGMVFFVRNNINDGIRKLLLGFASGIMIAACVWSLLIPSIEMGKNSMAIPWLPACIGFLFGIFFLIFLDKLIGIIEKNRDCCEKNKFSKTTKMALVVTLHNIPEGMAVGVAFAGVLAKMGNITIESAIALAIGIAIQNFPEGAIISLPLKGEGISRSKAFVLGVLSGIVEPIGAVMTIFLTSFVTAILPYLLAFAAGAMVYVVVKELIPESICKKYPNIGVIGTSLGFIIMMILDVSLG